MARPRKEKLVASESGPMTLEAVAAQAVQTLEPAPAAETPKTQEAAELFQKALAAFIASDPKAAEAAMTQVLGVNAGVARKVDERRRVVDPPKGAFDPLPPPPAPEPKPGVVYYCEAAEHRQVIAPSQKKFYGDGNVEIIAANVKQAENHIIRIEDPEEVKLMDAKIKKQTTRGGKPLIVKLRDEIAEGLQVRGAIANPNPDVNVNTPLSDLVA